MTLTLNYEAPATGDNSGTGTWLALLGCSARGLVVLALTGKKGKRAARFMGLLLAFMLVVPVSANATTVKATIEFSGSFGLYDKLIATYDGKNGTAETHEVVDYNKEFTTTAAPTKTGYTFKGWNDGKVDTAAAGKYTATDDVTFTAKWSPITYKVVFNSNCQEGTKSPATGTMNDQTFTYGQAQTLTAIGFTRTGYKFDGWATASDGAKVYDNIASVSNLTTVNNATVNLYAHWTAETYEIKYRQADGTTDETMPVGTKTTYTVEDTTLTLSNPSTDTDFICWINDANGTPVSAITKEDLGSYKFVAVYKDSNPGSLTIADGINGTNDDPASSPSAGVIVQKGNTTGWGASGSLKLTNSNTKVAYGETLMIELTVTTDTDTAYNLVVDHNAKVDTASGTEWYGSKWVVVDGKRYANLDYTGNATDGLALSENTAHKVQIFMTNNNGKNWSSQQKMYNSECTIGFVLSNLDASSTMIYNVTNVKYGVLKLS